MIAGLLVVVFTDKLGMTLAGFIGVDPPWGVWPWTIHSAAWGLACNVAACLIISPLTRRGPDRERRLAAHAFLAEADSRPAGKARLRSVAWAIALAWFFFALGPGLVIGSYLFGAPNAGPAAWIFGLPSIWAWQIVWWALGVLFLWLLAYKLDLATPPDDTIEPLADSVRRRT